MAEEFADATFAVSTEHGLVMYQAEAKIARGWAQICQGGQEGAIEQMRQGLAEHLATGAEVLRPHFLALLGEAFGKAGQPGERVRMLDQALAVAHRTGEGYNLAELYRLKGELLLTKAGDKGVLRAAAGGKPGVHPGQRHLIKDAPALAEAESCFHQALEIAEQQKAKSWELRAAMSLARLYQVLGKPREAQAPLARIYDEFGEGFDTLDLREAKALLRELS